MERDVGTASQIAPTNTSPTLNSCVEHLIVQLQVESVVEHGKVREPQLNVVEVEVVVVAVHAAAVSPVVVEQVAFVHVGKPAVSVAIATTLSVMVGSAGAVPVAEAKNLVVVRVNVVGAVHDGSGHDVAPQSIQPFEAEWRQRSIQLIPLIVTPRGRDGEVSVSPVAPQDANGLILPEMIQYRAKLLFVNVAVVGHSVGSVAGLVRVQVPSE